MIVKGGYDSQAREHETQKSTAHIAHEELCLWEIEQQESQGAGRYGVAYDIGKVAAMCVADVTEKRADNDCGPTSNPIDAIHEVEGIGKADNPDKGDDISNETDLHLSCPRQSNLIYQDSEGHYGNG